MEARSAPAPLWIIAVLALLPFPASALIYAFAPNDLGPGALTTILTWSAVVLSFLGGVRWGLESGREDPRAGRLAASVISPIAAWLLVMGRAEMGAALVICGFMAAFMLQWLFDHAAPDVPARYPRLSTTLTAGACISLAMALEKALRL
ncbi:DUF3429 domain-containing protein [Phenylobacterium sp.]|uniref:DUF3429 domain-containing protein n=1 Tax=Phenylobacterium sp. TaxID=1871053 RepID=UPI00273370D9|nr:DUF3429 domain-containing protein [Phenylobacterium sp.]MDP3660450.1 DUF3429 domain-containing protein [Phenylobacterium sp.]